MSSLHFNVGGDSGDDVPILITDNPPGGTTVVGTFPASNRMTMACPPTVTGGATVYYQQRRKSFRVIVPPENPPGAQWEAGQWPCLPPESQPDDVALHYAPILEPLPRLVVAGQFLRQDTGARFSVVEASSFNLLNRFDLGEDIAPVFAQRQALGFNVQRVWTGYRVPGIGDCDPRVRSSLYEKIPAFLDLAAEYGQYIEFTAITGFVTDPMSPGQMVEHWEKLIAAGGAKTNVVLEVFNEYGLFSELTVDPMLFRRPVGILSSHGSGYQDQLPVRPFWDVVTYRPGGGSEWQRKTGHNAMEDVADPYHLPCWSNETIRMPDTDGNPDHAFDQMAGAALLCAGGCFHSPEGKLGLEFTGQTLECATAAAQGARSVPLEFQDGRYSRVDPNPPGILRVYRRTLSDGRFHEVRIRE